ncbi:S-adenosylmethionine-dependent methyltransferase [Lithohypha guttulata]|uniref:tRNA wybutosine-synthesizing protein 2 n=1 Tax=Lithohypha guttulata TaxID=1690604 RepID=A0AAN7T1S1_9EURO|nr:S-adenosylmethionine-dependent methyltransferase [Lithohypha guttulata]
MESRHYRHHGKKRPTNLLIRSIEDFVAQQEILLSPLYESGSLDGHSEPVQSGTTLHSQDLPKRYTIYGNLLLLPAAFPEHSFKWQTYYQALSQSRRADLFSTIASVFSQSGHQITHIGLNAPIQSKLLGGAQSDKQNAMRSPVDLQPLYGDFGPERLLSSATSQPSKNDFESAFWVETTQVSNVTQVWAPRWTMFSRGNVREKARVLQITQQYPAPFPGLTMQELGQPLSEVDIVDMYVGIGYFAIPYLKRGARRVFGWDINGWSIEGLRRGCEKNNFTCEVVKVPNEDEGVGPERLAAEVASLIRDKESLRCIAFWGDNRHALSLLSRVQATLAESTAALNIRHCNLGLLPTSSGSWRNAVELVKDNSAGWLHVHENADTQQVEHKRQTVLDSILSLANEPNEAKWNAACQHTEMVKTYAPGIGHFVFDIKLWPATS